MTFALIVAGGTGTRMGAGMPKQFLPLQGVPVLVHTVRQWLLLLPNSPVVCVLHPDWVMHWQTLAQSFFTTDEIARLHTVPGGSTRTQSVYEGLKCCEQLAQKTEPIVNGIVAIHDGVRPFFTAQMVADSVAAAQRGSAGVCAVGVKSSMRVRTPDGGSLPVDRDLYYHVQTPQTFPLSHLLDAYHKLHTQEFTDDASLWEAAGHRVELVTGSYDNLKLTTPEDLAVAEVALGAKAR